MPRKNFLDFFEEFWVFLLPGKACLSLTLGVNHSCAWWLMFVTDWHMSKTGKGSANQDRYGKCLQAFMRLYRLYISKKKCKCKLNSQQS